MRAPNPMMPSLWAYVEAVWAKKGIQIQIPDIQAL
jgi:hypothetical protein